MVTPMQDEEEKEQKRPIDMTSDELLDYSIHPAVAERVKEMARESDDLDDTEG